jgi:hypothetical protein
MTEHPLWIDRSGLGDMVLRDGLVDHRASSVQPRASRSRRFVSGSRLCGINRCALAAPPRGPTGDCSLPECRSTGRITRRCIPRPVRLAHRLPDSPTAGRGTALYMTHEPENRPNRHGRSRICKTPGALLHMFDAIAFRKNGHALPEVVTCFQIANFASGQPPGTS